MAGFRCPPRSIKLKHVDLVDGKVYQDACEVKTNFSKSFSTFFFPVGGDVREIVTDWVNCLRRELLWGNDDPLFPTTAIVRVHSLIFSGRDGAI